MMPLRRLLITLGIVLWLEPSVAATAIVVFRRADRIILAADEVVTVTDDVTRVTTTERACKIRHSGHFYFLIAGFQGNRIGLDVFALVAHAIARSPTMDEALQAIRAAGSRLSAGMLASSRDDGGPPLLEIAVAGVTNGVLTAGLIGATVTPHAPVELTWHVGTCPGGCGAAGHVNFSASVAEDGPVVALMNANPRPVWLQAGTAAAARRLITLQIDTTPTRVGKPIDVLQIDAAGGAQWMDREKGSACAEIGK